MTHTHEHNLDYKKLFTVTPKEDSTVEIVGELPYEALLEERPAAIKQLGKQLKVDGFRKGHLPEAVIISKVGEMAILTEMAERAVAHHYGHIVEAFELAALGRPQIALTKIAPENPLGFTATTAVFPDFTLPNYKEIAHVANLKKVTAVVEEADVDKQISDILRQKVAYERLQKKAVAKSAKDKSEETANNNKNEDVIESQEDLDKLPLPELTDELVKTLGQPGQFTDVTDFKAKIKEHLQIEKEREATAKNRTNVTEAVMAETKLVVPRVLLDAELSQMWAEMQDNLSQANLQMGDYLKHIKKTETELKKEWEGDAKKRVELQLILSAIAKEEQPELDQEAVTGEVEAILKQYPGADEERVRSYVTNMMTNEAVMKMLTEA